MTEERHFNLISAADSHVGQVRKLNEDSFLQDPANGLWAVADGVGGHSAGDYASQLVVRLLGQVGPRRSASAMLAAVREQIETSNRNLLAFAANEGIGIAASTVVALLCHGEHFACVWVGDSRIYRLRDGLIEQLTRDHSEVQELVDAGVLSAEDAKHHPRGNVVTRAVGAEEEVKPDIVADLLVPGDIFLLCSDGVSKVLDDDEIGALLRPGAPEDSIAGLIEAVLTRGAPDNTTAVVVECLGAEPPGEDSTCALPD